MIECSFTNYVAVGSNPVAINKITSVFVNGSGVKH